MGYQTLHRKKKDWAISGRVSSFLKQSDEKLWIWKDGQYVDYDKHIISFGLQSHDGDRNICETMTSSWILATLGSVVSKHLSICFT